MRLAIFGDPVDHSLSPQIHGAALRAAGMDGSYIRQPVSDAELSQAVSLIREGELDGANVTMPHKITVMAECDRVTATAKRAGAVNTLYRSGSGVVGHNTDIAGVKGAWRDADFPDNAPVLILGAGGAAAAAVLALQARTLVVAARDQDRAEQLLVELGVGADTVPWDASLGGHVVVNATPLGMGGEELPAGFTSDACGLIDMVYGANESPAIASSRGRGIPTVDGTRMLLHQAAAAFEIWTGHGADVAAMNQALDAARESH